MTRSVNDVDLVITVGNGGVFGENGDPSLFFDVIAVHDTLIYLLVGSKGSRLLEKFVYQCGLAVVDVCDNSDVFDFLHENSYRIKGA